MCCPDCDQPYEVAACVDKRYHINGVASDPIPWGEGSQYLTHELQILQSSGPTTVIDPEQWGDRSCPACVVEIEVLAPRSPRRRLKQLLSRLL